MKFSPPLKPAKLLKRYKRFLADVEMADGTITTIHVANTGAMTGCADPGDIVWYSTSNNSKRKYPLSWELTEKPNGNLICVNTMRANQLTEQALNEKLITEVTQYNQVQREVKYGNENSKIDFLLKQTGLPDTYIEVKSVTLLAPEVNPNKPQQGYFPDAVSTRGQKHLRELMEIKQQGHRAILLFAVLHSGITSCTAAKHIDKKYAELLSQAQQAGVEVLAYQATLSNDEMKLTQQIPVIL